MYETQRLTEDLYKFQIDIRNVVINQVLFENADDCRMCKARMKMQKKYIDDITELFEDFHITCLPMLPEEVRGVGNLMAFSKFLLGGK